MCWDDADVLLQNTKPLFHWSLNMGAQSYLKYDDGCSYTTPDIANLLVKWLQGPLLLTWFNFNPSMDK